MKTHLKSLIFVLALSVFLAGCSTLEEMNLAPAGYPQPKEDRKEFVNRWEEGLSDRIKRAILSGRIVNGMQENHVKATIGLPESINYTTLPNGEKREQWVYPDGVRYVYFENGYVSGQQVRRNIY